MSSETHYKAGPTVMDVLTFRWDINIRQSSLIGLVMALEPCFIHIRACRN